MIIEDGVAYVIDETFAKVDEIGPAFSVYNYGELYKIFTDDGEKILMVN